MGKMKRKKKAEINKMETEIERQTNCWTNRQTKKESIQ